MARPLRLQIAHGVYPITNLGVERRNMVRDEEDRRTWLRLLGRVAQRCGWRVFAYALLDKHFHLFLGTPEPNLSRGTQDFQSGYGTLPNRRHERVRDKDMSSAFRRAAWFDRVASPCPTENRTEVGHEPQEKQEGFASNTSRETPGGATTENRRGGRDEPG